MDSQSFSFKKAKHFAEFNVFHLGWRLWQFPKSLCAFHIGINRCVSVMEGVRPRKTNGEKSRNFSALINLTVSGEIGNQHSALLSAVCHNKPRAGSSSDASRTKLQAEHRRMSRTQARVCWQRGAEAGCRWRAEESTRCDSPGFINRPWTLRGGLKHHWKWEHGD